MRHFTSRRGLSTIVTTAILLTAVTILGTMIVAWSNGNLKSYETVLSNTASTNTNKINENLVIENIAFCANCDSSGGNNVINVTLTNTGTVNVKINQIQINSTVITSYSKSTTLPQNISPQNSYTVAAKLSTKWHSKSTDTITVTTARSLTHTTQAAPP
jgi:hypothetical protein